MSNSSFVGSMVNPIVDARTRQAISSNGLAKKLGLSRQYMQRAEAGTYTNLNPSLLNWTAHALGVNTRDITKNYEAFQNAQRRATIEKIDPHKLVRQTGNTESGSRLFERWRSGYWISPVSFSNAFCIHPESVRLYEEEVTKKIPKAIFEVLLEHNLIDANWRETAPQGEALRGRLSA